MTVVAECEADEAEGEGLAGVVVVEVEPPNQLSKDEVAMVAREDMFSSRPIHVYSTC